MKQEDFDRLKAVCEKEGFEIGFKYNESTYTVRLKKDIWEGVEFVEALVSMVGFTEGKIYKVVNLKDDEGYLLVNFDDRYLEENGMTPCNFKPSTESAYVEQLKAEAFKRFGEIKDGDRFFCSDRNGIFAVQKGDEFRYFKDKDLLLIGTWDLYQKGKWATIVKERVKVSPASSSQLSNGIQDFKFVVKGRDFLKNGALDYLASKLEEYLNKD